MATKKNTRDPQRVVEAYRKDRSEHYRPIEADILRFVLGLGGAFMIAVPFFEGWRWSFLPIFGIPASWWLGSRAQRYFWLKDFQSWQVERHKAAKRETKPQVADSAMKAGAEYGLEMQSDDVRCPRCGCELTSPSRLCPECGSEASVERGVWTMPQAYCVKCNKKVEMLNPRRITLENGQPGIQGVCPTCRTKVLRTVEA